MQSALAARAGSAVQLRLQRASASRRSVVARSGVKLYTNPASRGKIVEWYIKEVGKEAEVDLVQLDMKDKKEHKAPEFLAVNPFGKLPALEDGDLKLFESGALLLYLAERFGETNTPEKRARAAQWVLFANATLTFAYIEQFRERGLPAAMGPLDQILGSQPWLEGQEFSVCDVAVGAYLLYLPAFFPQVDLSPWPNVKAYMDRLLDRPACAETVGARQVQRRKEEEQAKAAAAN